MANMARTREVPIITTSDARPWPTAQDQKLSPVPWPAWQASLAPMRVMRGARNAGRH